METIIQVFNYISGLGNYVLIPLMIFLVGLLVKLNPIKALRSGIIVGIGLIGLDLVLGLIWSNISPVTELLVELFGLNLTTIDTGWATAAGVAFSTPIGAFIIPFILVVNIAMLSLRLTKTMNIDIWNYWHYAFSGAVVYLLTNNLIFGFVAAAAHCIIALIIADRTAKEVQEIMGLPGISIPQGFAVSSVPVFKALDKVYDILLPFTKKNNNEETTSQKHFGVLKTLTEPIFLGLMIGVILGLSVGYPIAGSLKLGMSMAALMFLLPRMIKILMEGLLPISDATRNYMSKKYVGEEIYIGLDSAVLLGHPTTATVGLILIPIALVLSMIIPWNTTLPLGDLAATAFFVSMATIIHKQSFTRTLISGTIMIGIVLSVASFFAPQLTQFAANGGTAIPAGAAQITALSAGNLIALLLHSLSNLEFVGILMIVVAVGALVAWNKKYPKVATLADSTEEHVTKA